MIPKYRGHDMRCCNFIVVGGRWQECGKPANGRLIGSYGYCRDHARARVYRSNPQDALLAAISIRRLQEVWAAGWLPDQDDGPVVEPRGKRLDRINAHVKRLADGELDLLETFLHNLHAMEKA